MELVPADQDLINLAANLVRPTAVPGGIIRKVGSALRISDGRIYTGICMHLVCGLAACAEYAAIVAALKEVDTLQIDTIVAVNKFGIIPPCGRCRELMNVVSSNGPDIWVVISPDEKVQLSELLPHAWDASQSLSSHLV